MMHTIEETQLIQLDRLADAEPVREPFEYVVVKDFLQPQQIDKIIADFPDIRDAGSLPTSQIECRGQFAKLLAEMQGPGLRQLIEDKFTIDLTDKPSMVTVRGRVRKTDGKIHHDTKTKLITALLYLNEEWESSGGRLRLLRDGQDINSTIEEIPPIAGTLLLFKVSNNSWHGHLPAEGVRRSIQLNYVVGQDVVEKELARHRVSSRVKRIKRMVRL